MMKKVPCPKCEGWGHIAIVSENSIGGRRCEECYGTGEVEVPMTNADRIRAMSDEELAEWLMGDEIRSIIDKPVWCGSDCEADNGCPHEKKCCVNWLQQPEGGADHA